MRAYIAPGVLNMIIIWHFHIGTHRHAHTRAYYKDSIVLDPLTNAKAEMSKPVYFPLIGPPSRRPHPRRWAFIQRVKRETFRITCCVCLSPLSRMTFRPPLYYTHVEMDRRLHLAASATTGPARAVSRGSGSFATDLMDSPQSSKSCWQVWLN
jgi:hypothetical protein